MTREQIANRATVQEQGVRLMESTIPAQMTVQEYRRSRNSKVGLAPDRPGSTPRVSGWHRQQPELSTLETTRGGW